MRGVASLITPRTPLEFSDISSAQNRKLLERFSRISSNKLVL